VTHPNEAHYHFTHSLPDLLRLTNDFFVGRLCALAAAAVGSTARCVALGQLISRRSRAGDGAESPGGGACLQQPRSGAAGGAERDVSPMLVSGLSPGDVQASVDTSPSAPGVPYDHVLPLCVVFNISNLRFGSSTGWLLIRTRMVDT
jgi:hypothetical protein